MDSKFHLYTYNGPVYLFDKMITSSWTAQTRAVNSARARANLEYRYKLQAGLLPTAKITLTGKIVEVT